MGGAMPVRGSVGGQLISVGSNLGSCSQRCLSNRDRSFIFHAYFLTYIEHALVPCHGFT